jgi:hypothetical protein
VSFTIRVTGIPLSKMRASSAVSKLWEISYLLSALYGDVLRMNGWEPPAATWNPSSTTAFSRRGINRLCSLF